MRMQSRWSYALCLALCAAVVLAAARWPASPDVQYKTVSTFEMGGFLGRIARMATPDEMIAETYVTTDVMMTGDENSAQIINLADETFTMVNHRKKEYSTLTFEEMKAMWEEQRAEMQASQEDAASESDGDSNADVNVEMDFWIDSPGDVETINGHRAERFIITVLADVEASAEDEQQPGTVQTVNSQIAIVNEVWRASLDGFETVDAFHMRYAEKMGEVFLGARSQEQMMEALSAILQGDERLTESLKRAQQEAATMEGTNASLRSVTHIVLVPMDQEYDASLVFAQKEEPKKKRGFGGLVKRMAEQAAGADSGDPAEAEQRTLMTMTSDLTDYSTGPIDPATFTPPANYDQVPFGN